MYQNTTCYNKRRQKSVQIAQEVNGNGFDVVPTISWADVGCNISTRKIRWYFYALEPDGKSLILLHKTAYHLLSDAFFVDFGTYIQPNFENGLDSVFDLLDTLTLPVTLNRSYDKIVMRAEIADCKGATKLSYPLLLRELFVTAPHWSYALYQNVPVAANITSSVPLPLLDTDMTIGVRVIRDGLVQKYNVHYTKQGNVIVPTIPTTGVENFEVFVWTV